MTVKCCRAFACFLVLAPVTTFAQGDAAKDKGTQDQIVKMTQDVVAAEVRGDMPALDRIYASNYVHMHENGLVENKDAHKLSLVSGGVRKYKTADISDTQVYFFGVGAMITGHENWEQAKGFSHHQFVAFWIQDQGKWRLAAWIAKPPQKGPVEPARSK